MKETVFTPPGERASLNVTLRQLRAFVTVAQLGSFVEASRAFHVTPAALSIIVGEFESVLGFRVFDRTTRRVRLSAAGEQYYPYAQRILAEIESAGRFARDLRNRKVGVVRIVTSQVIAWTLMPPVFAAFRTLRPDIRIDPIDANVDAILPTVEEGRADIAITLKTQAGPGLQVSHLFDSRVHLACRADSPWAARKRVSWSELVGQPLIFTGIDTPARINAELQGRPLLEASWQVANTGTALALVSSGFGAAICAGYVRPMTAIQKLKMVPLVDPVVVRSFATYTSRSRAPAPAQLALDDFLHAHFSQARGGLAENLPIG